MKCKFFLAALFCSFCCLQNFAQTRLFNDNWEFVEDIDTLVDKRLFATGGEIRWSKVSLPHTANLEPIEKVAQQWQGTCFYRKNFIVAATEKGKRISLRFDAAMHEADVYLNGHALAKHYGGYLPFSVDLTPMLNYGASNVLLVKLNNSDNADIPPGKPLKDLDFNYYSGIYRNVWMVITPKLFITDAVESGTIAGGGIFINYDTINRLSAVMNVRAELSNQQLASQQAQVRFSLSDNTGKLVTAVESPAREIMPGTKTLVNEKLTISKPKLWSVNSPYLYRLKVELLSGGKLIQSEQVATGVRTIRFDAASFYLNNNKVAIRGTNRHQEYPYIGNALSDNAQYRDAWKIKMAGFNFVRTSHYPQSPAFLDACDELGILVMDAIPGWQFVGNQLFQQRSLQDGRDMIRRDRNHPSIILWETSLNESRMPKAYMQKAHDIVHEELPFKNIYSAGWMDDVYDVYLPARQHGKAPDYWKKYSKNKPLIVAEYGDWEYYAGNAGFNQKDYQNLKKEEKSSRQLRGFGEKRMLQQALNFQEAHNDNLSGRSPGDANWLMFDYKRGYAPDIESSGIMDIQRLPKFSWYFYQSQVDPVVGSKSAFTQPMVFIANYWNKDSDSVIMVYSNCNEVELLLNGKAIARERPTKNNLSANLKHPPFQFHMPAFVAGSLTANGYINNKLVATSKINTSVHPAKLTLVIDESGKPLTAGQNDVVFVYAKVIDANGNLVTDANNTLTFAVMGDAEIIADKAVKAEAGIATILLKAGDRGGNIKVSATATGLKPVELTVKVKQPK